MKKSHLDDILFSLVTKSSDFTRNQGVWMARPELLSEHLVEVQIIGYQLIKYMEYHDISDRFNIHTYLEKALLHDLDEVITGDIPRNTKYHTVEGKKALERVADDALDIIEEHYPFLKGVKEITQNSKNGLEGWILKIADMLSVYRRVVIEIDVRGNKSPLRIAKELVCHISLLINEIKLSDDLSEAEEEYFLELLELAKSDSLRYVELYGDTIDKFSFIENQMSIYNKE